MGVFYYFKLQDNLREELGKTRKSYPWLPHLPEQLMQGSTPGGGLCVCVSVRVCVQEGGVGEDGITFLNSSLVQAFFFNLQLGFSLPL